MRRVLLPRPSNAVVDPELIVVVVGVATHVRAIVGGEGRRRLTGDRATNGRPVKPVALERAQ